MTTDQNLTRHCLFDTALGPCGVAWNERGLRGVQLPEADRAKTGKRLAAKTASAGEADPPPSVQGLIADIQRYLAGEPVDFSPVAVDLDGVDPFRRKLYETMRGIAWAAPRPTANWRGRSACSNLKPRATSARRWDKSDAAGHPVPPRARRGKEARWFFRARRRRDEAEAVGVGGRAPRRRRAAAAGVLTALCFCA